LKLSTEVALTIFSSRYLRTGYPFGFGTPLCPPFLWSLLCACLNILQHAAREIMERRHLISIYRVHVFSLLRQTSFYFYRCEIFLFYPSAKQKNHVRFTVALTIFSSRYLRTGYPFGFGTPLCPPFLWSLLCACLIYSHICHLTCSMQQGR
jgi:hypothetical protein